ncbi:hypothetical protein K450DRAFT_218145 [Umbelopsis ramanniana AG]|uniref:PB1 domain-containing protein n=1 Tax=Umbelopsis ramanniana AG TaxID=1314678 RepID=A0AAD5HH20_UMBRA|nr:uncharacterized protein K450DRAFT_218145 [Umbelopsis ramanniana AG]KAI8584100.1 hypothetical protein K450DRAFT_218145 [Umbelopsis ramanniana AG]
MVAKFELEQWLRACEAYDREDYDQALKLFIGLADTAKMHFNIGLVLATIDDYPRALAAYSKAIELDQYFAVAYFQRGVSAFIIGDMDLACAAFDEAYTVMRGNNIINYGQLGLAFHLYACEVLFNRGICKLYNNQVESGLKDLEMANAMKLNNEHDIIEKALKDEGKGYSIFSIPSKVLYRPPKSRLEHMEMFAVAAEVHSEKSNGTRQNSVIMDRPRKQHRLNFKSLMTRPSYKMVAKLLPSRSAGTELSPDKAYKEFMPPPPPPFITNDSQPRPSLSAPNLSQQQRESTVFAVSRKKIKDDDYKQLQQESIWKTLPTSPVTAPSSPDEEKTLAMISLEFPIPDANSTLTLDPRNAQLRKDSGFHSEDSSGGKTPISDTTMDDSRSHSHHDDEDVMGYYETNHHEGDVFSTYEALRDLQDDINMNVRLKIKLHFDDMRILVVPATVSFSELAEKVKDKFDGKKDIKLLFKDEDDEFITMQDETDIMQARIAWKKRQEQAGSVPAEHSNPEKLDLWCHAC